MYLLFIVYLKEQVLIWFFLSDLHGNDMWRLAACHTIYIYIYMLSKVVNCDIKSTKE